MCCKRCYHADTTRITGDLDVPATGSAPGPGPAGRPGGPRDRPPALPQHRGAPARLHARPRRGGRPGRRPAVRRPRTAPGRPRPLRDAHARLAGRLAGAARRPPGRRRPDGDRLPADLAAVLQPLAPLPRHALALLARARARRGVRRDRAAERGERRSDLRPDRGHDRRARVPPAGPARPVPHRGTRHDRRRHVRPRPPCPARGDRPRGARDPDLPPGRRRPRRELPLARRRRRSGTPRGHRDGHLQGLRRSAAATAARVRGGGRAGHRPRARHRRHHAAGRRGGGADLRGGPRRHRHR